MKEVIEIVDPEERNRNEGYGLDSDMLVQQSGAVPVIHEEEPTSKRRGPGRPPKNGTSITYTDLVTEDNKSTKAKKDNVFKEYEKKYVDTTKLLYSAILQSDNIYTDIGLELDKFRNNMRYGGKMRMQHMSDFMNTQASLINTKINAIKELDSIKHKINDLTLKKEQMLKAAGEENSDKAITDAYYALINAPKYGLPSFKSPITPMSINTGINLQGAPVSTQNIVTDTNVDTSIVTDTNSGTFMASSNVDPSFEDYKRNITPIQRAMIAEKDPNIKTVVVYDQTTGNKYFDVVDVQSGQSIPGVQRPAEFLLDAMRIDARNGIATNSNTNMTFPLVIIGTRAVDEL